MLVVPSDALDRSRLATVVCGAITSNLNWDQAPGNVLLASAASGLAKDAVVNVSQVVTVDKSLLRDRVGRLSASQWSAVQAGLNIVLGR